MDRLQLMSAFARLCHVYLDTDDNDRIGSETTRHGDTRLYIEVPGPIDLMDLAALTTELRALRGFVQAQLDAGVLTVILTERAHSPAL